MHILTIDDDGNAEKKARLLKALAPKLWANLRNEAAECVKDMKPSDLTGDGRRGVDAILAALGKRFPEHTNRKLPRVYMGFYRGVKFQSEMGRFLSELEQAAVA